jgi:hypothetical protein
MADPDAESPTGRQLGRSILPAMMAPANRRILVVDDDAHRYTVSEAPRA